MTYVPGPFSTDHLYLQWGGKLPGGEVWSNGIRLAPTNIGPPPAVTPALLTSFNSAVTNFHLRATSFISPRAKLSFVKVNHITAAGLYAESVTHENVVADVGGTGSDGNTPANQVALAISLATAVTRGPAHRGRWYMPLPCVFPQTDGLIALGDALNVKNSATTFLSELNAINADAQVVVMSRKAGAPASRIVTHIEVGRVLDTQRRRRNKLVEAYQ